MPKGQQHVAGSHSLSSCAALSALSAESSQSRACMHTYTDMTSARNIQTCWAAATSLATSAALAAAALPILAHSWLALSAPAEPA